MDIALTVILLLLLVGLSGVLARSWPSLPLPLIQVAIGALAASPAIGLRVSFDPELFMLLFVPPLLFADGWRVPKREFFALRGPILTLALGLVFFTVLGAGYFVHWAIPAIPLSVAFALAAVLSPTDAVAVSAVSGQVKVPPRLMHALEGEALLNDASGLVAMKFAIAATLTGSFSLLRATGNFLIMSVGGLAVGFGVAWLLSWVHRVVTSRRGPGPVAHIVLLLLLIPFAVYLLAERLEVSGILAAVAAGMMINFTDLPRRGQVTTRMQARGLSTMIEFVFNGLVFLLLGLQLPPLFGQPLRRAARMTGLGAAWHLFAHAAIIWVALVVLRFVWIWGCLRLGVYWARLRGKQRDLPPPRIIGAATFAGIRGAVTLAGVLSVPLTLPDGSPFPARELLIFLASGVILLSLLGGCFGLPVLLRGVQWPREDKAEHEELEARTRAAEAAIRAIEVLQLRLATGGGDGQWMGNAAEVAICRDSLARILTRYRQRIDAAREGEDAPRSALRVVAFEREVHLSALRAERTEVYHLRSLGRINDETLRTLVDEIDLVEASLLGGAEPQGSPRA
ncbi:MAG: Na+/H+ antiporter [Verrucomicrobia bacterium]|nr:Na+/H+ antiporter [Verrucomicrobiota bacterium]